MKTTRKTEHELWLYLRTIDAISLAKLLRYRKHKLPPVLLTLAEQLRDGLLAELHRDREAN